MKKTLILAIFLIVVLSGCSKQTTSAPSPILSAETPTVSEPPVASGTPVISAAPGSTDAPNAPNSPGCAPSVAPNTPIVSDTPKASTAPKVSADPNDPNTTKPSKPSAPADDAELLAARDNVTAILEENAETLTKYANATGNGLIAFFGLDDIMNDIKTESRAAVDKTAGCCPLADKCTNEETLQQYYGKIADIQLRLTNDSDKIKESKKACDIDALKPQLDDLLYLIKDYNKLLVQFEKELKE